MSKPLYRLNVAGIMRNREGKILIGERLGMSGAWQIPQGGVDEGETPEQALVREMWEEIGLDAADFKIVQQKDGYRYLFPKRKKGHDGKDQIYFLCDYLAADDKINIQTEHPEFQAYRWIAPWEFKKTWLPDMKIEVYKAVFKDFFGLTLA